MRNVIVFLYILYNSGLMQLEGRKVEGDKLLCLFKKRLYKIYKKTITLRSRLLSVLIEGR